MNWVKANRISHEVEGLNFSLCQVSEGGLFNSASESISQCNSLNLVIFLYKMYLYSITKAYLQKALTMKFSLSQLLKKNMQRP